MKTRHQLKTEATVPRCIPKVWHLDLKLQKDCINDDLKAFSFIPTIDKLSSSSAQSKGTNVTTAGASSDVIKSLDREQIITRRELRERESKKKSIIPCTKRLTSNTDNNAVRSLYNLCTDLWEDCTSLPYYNR